MPLFGLVQVLEVSLAFPDFPVHSDCLDLRENLVKLDSRGQRVTLVNLGYQGSKGFPETTEFQVKREATRS